MPNLITTLLTLTKTGGKLLFSFLSVFLLGVIVIILFVLPWLLRLCMVLLWLAAGYVSLIQIETLYRPYTSSPIPVHALEFALILLLVAMPMAGMLRKPEYIWGSMSAGGFLIALTFWKLVPWLLQHWEHAGIFFRALPSTLSIVLLITATLRMKKLRTKQLTAKGGDPSP